MSACPFPSKSYGILLFLVSDQPISQQSLSNTSRVSTSAIPIASFSRNIHRTATITNERDLGQTTGDDRRTRHRYTRDIVTTHKKPDQLWRGAAWRGV